MGSERIVCTSEFDITPCIGFGPRTIACVLTLLQDITHPHLNRVSVGYGNDGLTAQLRFMATERCANDELEWFADSARDKLGALVALELGVPYPVDEDAAMKVATHYRRPFRGSVLRRLHSKLFRELYLEEIRGAG